MLCLLLGLTESFNTLVQQSIISCRQHLFTAMILGEVVHVVCCCGETALMTDYSLKAFLLGWCGEGLLCKACTS